MTRLRRHYTPVRLPFEPVPFATVEAATLVRNGDPPLARSPACKIPGSACRVHYPGGPVQVHIPAAFLVRAAFPEIWAGRRPQLPFQGRLRLYSRYGPSICSTARSGLCRRASTGPVAQPRRLPAIGPTDHCPGGTGTHKVIAPFGAHQISQMTVVSPPRHCVLVSSGKWKKLDFRQMQ